MADVKLETDIVEKRLFGVKKKITYYTLSTFPKYLVNQRFMLSCKFLGCCLKRGFKLQHAIGCMLLDTPTVVLK